MRKFLQYIIATVVAGVITLSILGAKGTFLQSDLQSVYADLSDAFFVSGVMLGGVGLLVFASHGGAFDMLRFAFIKLIDLFKRDMTKVKYRTFYDYSEAQKDKPKGSILYLLVVGLVFIALAALFLFLYHNVA